VVEASVKEFLAESALFVNDSCKSRVFKSVKHGRSSGGDDAMTDGESVDGLTDVSDTALVSDEEFMTQTSMFAAISAPIDVSDPAATLTAGIQDITNTLVGDYNLNDVLRIILETMYRAMGFSQVLLWHARREKNHRLQGAFSGYGAKDRKACSNRFAVQLGQAAGTRSSSPLAKHVSTCSIADTHAVNIVSRQPGVVPRNRERADVPACCRS
jgi:hypothetical protein